MEIDCYEWVLGKIDVNKIPFDRLERIIKATIKDLEKRKDKAIVRTDTIKPSLTTFTTLDEPLILQYHDFYGHPTKSIRIVILGFKGLI